VRCSVRGGTCRYGDSRLLISDRAQKPVRQRLCIFTSPSTSAQLIKYLKILCCRSYLELPREPLRISRCPNTSRTYSCSSNRPPRPRTSLSRVQPGLLTHHRFWRLLYDLCAFGEDQLDVAGVRHVWVDLVRRLEGAHVQYHPRA